MSTKTDLMSSIKQHLGNKNYFNSEVFGSGNSEEVGHKNSNLEAG